MSEVKCEQGDMVSHAMSALDVSASGDLPTLVTCWAGPASPGLQKHPDLRLPWEQIAQNFLCKSSSGSDVGHARGGPVLLSRKSLPPVSQALLPRGPSLGRCCLLQPAPS